MAAKSSNLRSAFLVQVQKEYFEKVAKFFSHQDKVTNLYIVEKVLEADNTKIEQPKMIADSILGRDW